MARDDDGNRGRERDDRYGQPIPPGREGAADRDPYGGALYGRAREESRERYGSPGGDERDAGYGAEPRARDTRNARDAEWSTSGRGGVGGGMGREGGGRYAGRPEDDARAMRYDRDDYDDGASRQGLRGGRGEGAGRDAAYDRDDARYDAWGARGELRDHGGARDHRGTMGSGMGGNAGWRSSGGEYSGGGSGASRDAQRDLQRDLQRGPTMDGARGEYGGGRDHGRDFGREHGRADLGDRNPGQGFGAFGWSNADESGPRVGGAARGAGATRDFSGRGPRNYQRSDERIREDVCERLTRHREIDASDIDIEVRDGIVTLAGNVEDKHAKRLAEDIAEEVMGVSDVRNELKAPRGGLLGGLFGRGEEGRPGGDRTDREVSRDLARESGAPASRTAGTAGSASASGTTGAAAPAGDAATTGATRESRRGRGE